MVFIKIEGTLGQFRAEIDNPASLLYYCLVSLMDAQRLKT